MQLEDSYVHEVYSKLATYTSGIPPDKVWPRVRKFLDNMPNGSMILDVGCGRSNHTAKNCFTLGFDICPDMVLKVKKRKESMDAALCISVLHHLSTFERRKQALSAIINTLKPRAQLMVYVWAYEQPNGTFASQDVLVPFNLHEIPKSGQLPLIKFHKDSTKEQRIINNSIPIQINEDACTRFLKGLFGGRLWKFIITSKQDVPPAIPQYLQKMSVQNVHQAVISGLHKWSPIKLAQIKIPIEEHFAKELSTKIMEEACAEALSTLRSVSYYRYYHVFKRGELEQLLETIPNIVIVESVYDNANWCILIEKKGSRPSVYVTLPRNNKII